MPQAIRDLMTKEVITLDAGDSARQAAQQMRDKDTGAIVVTQGGSLKGIVTDRDIVVRGVADGRDPEELTVGELCTGELATVSPDDSVDQVINVLREKKVRRVPVVEGDKPVGIISIGDLAIERDEQSALAEISAASQNN
jgi:CBS domain-containing protein